MVNPSPKGKKGNWKKGRGGMLNHSRPKGMVGFRPEEPKSDDSYRFEDASLGLLT